MALTAQELKDYNELFGIIELTAQDREIIKQITAMGLSKEDLEIWKLFRQ